MLYTSFYMCALTHLCFIWFSKLNLSYCGKQIHNCSVTQSIVMLDIESKGWLVTDLKSSVNKYRSCNTTSNSPERKDHEGPIS